MSNQYDNSSVSGHRTSLVSNAERPQSMDDLPKPPEWTLDALCAQTDPEAFFPEKGGTTKDAKRVCAKCDVREQCLQYALANDVQYGVWGGYSAIELRRMRRAAA
ncbi:MAG TPA: WhiB family transcriptional regulator [Galbitalea sp.]|jgi:WhiB family redox-sensing transcriptional regulator